jgi:hypothetical protein
MLVLLSAAFLLLLVPLSLPLQLWLSIKWAFL